MSAKPAPRPAQRPAPTRAFSRPASSAHTGRSVGDALLVVAGFSILIGIVYVGYRTQVSGEPIEAVLPFLAGRDAPAGRDAAPAESTDGLPEPAHTPVRKPVRAPGAPAAPAEDSDPDNTFFGRRERRSTKPVEPAPAR